MMQVSKEINYEHRDWTIADCAVFYKTKEENGGCSNMAGGFLLTVNGVSIRTSEALYQACRFPHLPEVQKVIIEQASPIAAKMKSKPHRDNTRTDWMEKRVDLMYWCLLLKLTQNWLTFGAVLNATGDRPIVEKSRKDPFWGAKAPKGVDEPEVLTGANVLGQLLVRLRNDYRRGAIPEVIEPLQIPDLLLYGEPIQAITR